MTFKDVCTEDYKRQDVTRFINKTVVSVLQHASGRSLFIRLTFDDGTSFSSNTDGTFDENGMYFDTDALPEEK